MGKEATDPSGIERIAAALPAGFTFGASTTA